MPPISASHKTTTTDTARTGATSNVEYIADLSQARITSRKFFNGFVTAHRPENRRAWIYFFFSFIEVRNGMILIAKAKV